MMKIKKLTGSGKKGISKKFIYSTLFLIFCCNSTFSQTSYISNTEKSGYFPLVSETGPAEIYIDSSDYKGVLRVVQDFRKDIERVTGEFPELHKNEEIRSANPVIIGTIGKSKLIKELVRNNKLDVSEIEGKWEAFSIQVVENPFPNVPRALVIVGSDKRGTIYGMYDVSSEIGVSPWYWWADVPPKKSDVLYVQPGKHSKGSPKVKYRGIFINDEAPALSSWAAENFGGFNSEFYKHVFELILRLKGNYLWPAMWGRAFYDDDHRNPILANEYGIVIGTSHHEPLMRAHDEWRRYGEGAWDYTTNAENLREFWRKGIERMGDNESVVTIGMRGDGDKPMSEGTAIALLEKIVEDQREIIAEVTGKPAAETPQVWALYKEVQEYYDQGMRVPDDVTLLLADDNWGNIRKLPKLTEEPRAGGYGIYYHFDYVGGPRNYKWINTSQISRVWEQMNLAYQYGADELWIVNVGDIKPMEFPISFFLDFAWNPEKIAASDLKDYTVNWSKQQFGEKYAEEIAEILLTYTKYNSRRKPELLSPETYSLINYKEAETILEDFKELVAKAERINSQLPKKYRDAYFQLLLFPVKASANLNKLYIAAAKNHLYAEQGRAATNEYAEKVRELFTKDAELTNAYHEISDGKWNHMMSQTHIGYTYWQQPEQNNMPQVAEIDLPEEPSMGITVEGSKKVWPNANSTASLPTFDPWNDQKFYIEIFNKGKESFEYEIKKEQSWLEISEEEGIINDQKRIWMNIDWKEAPKGKTVGLLKIEGVDSSVQIEVPIRNSETNNIKGFVESNGYISIEAPNFSENVQKEDTGWKLIPNLGRTGSAMAAFPYNPTHKKFSKNSPHLTYNFHTFSSGAAEIIFFLSPTLDFLNKGGLKFAFSIDDKKPQIINMYQDTKDDWATSVSNNITEISTNIELQDSGNHTLKVWAMDTGVVLQEILLETGKVEDSYLGPPESVKVK